MTGSKIFELWVSFGSMASAFCWARMAWIWKRRALQAEALIRFLRPQQRDGEPTADRNAPDFARETVLSRQPYAESSVQEHVRRRIH